MTPKVEYPTNVKHEHTVIPDEVEQTTGGQVVAGMIRSIPIMLGYLPVGFAFGVLATTAGLTLHATLAMSVFVYAGSSQLIAVGLIDAGTGTAAIAVTVFLVNLRHMLMSAYLAPYIGHLKNWLQVWFGYELTDETFAVHSAFFRSKGIPSVVELIALNMSAHLAWIGGSVLGAWAGGRLAFDTAAFGFDYALPGMFIALLVVQIDSRRRTLVAVLAALFGLAFYLAGMQQLYIILATVIAATIGVVIEKNGNSAKSENC
ncbi:MAG TPA: AzlC family ABC transporter permease [Candidatus Limnocylindrales bacterium]|nr:AzlC family ABC transporter permease [Candidatus Limnocylindrales bacterium]